MAAVVMFNPFLSSGLLTPLIRSALMIKQSPGCVSLSSSNVCLFFVVCSALARRSLWRLIRDEDWSSQSRTSCNGSSNYRSHQYFYKFELIAGYYRSWVE